MHSAWYCSTTRADCPAASAIEEAARRIVADPGRLRGLLLLPARDTAYIGKLAAHFVLMLCCHWEDAMRTLPLSVILLFAACGSAFSQISATLDQPQCYENVGCPHKDRISEAQIRDFSCENLWLVRNTIFHQRGYCFQNKRGRAEFDNGRCSSNVISELKLSPVEKVNVATLQARERRKGCQ